MPKAIAAWCEDVSGPGWANSIVHVLYTEGGTLTLETLQPSEQTAEMLILFPISATVNGEMLKAIDRRSRGKFVWEFKR